MSDPVPPINPTASPQQQVDFALLRYSYRPSVPGDGIHPPSDGYALVAEKVGAWQAWRAWLD